MTIVFIFCLSILFVHSFVLDLIYELTKLILSFTALEFYIIQMIFQV